MAPGLNINGYAIVTGAGSGIGAAVAKAYAAEGAAGVAFVDIDLAGAQATADEAKKVAVNPEYRGLVLAVDISTKENCEKMVADVVKEFGRLDYAANCAGVYVKVLAPSSLLPEEEFNRIQKVNVQGTLYCMQAEVEQMKKQEPKQNPWNPKRLPERGSVVTIASVTAWVAGPMAMAYTASKHAVNGIIKAFAIDHSTDYIRTNGVFPAWVDTPMLQNAEAVIPPEFQMAKRMRAMIPTNVIAQPDEVADAVIWLSSQRASYVNGNGITVDGAGCTWPASHHDV